MKTVMVFRWLPQAGIGGSRLSTLLKYWCLSRRQTMVRCRICPQSAHTRAVDSHSEILNALGGPSQVRARLDWGGLPD